MNLPPIPSDTPGSASRFKGVTKHGKKWQASIRIPSEGGRVSLGTFDSEEEAGIMYARARYKYPAEGKSGPKPKPCPLDLSEVPMHLPPIPSDRRSSASWFSGVINPGQEWLANVNFPSEGRTVHSATTSCTFESEEEASISHVRRASYEHSARVPGPYQMDGHGRAFCKL